MTSVHSVSNQRRPSLVHRVTIGFALMGALVIAQPSQAAWDTEAVEDVAAKTIDAVMIRPLATVRVVVGAALLVPASLFSSPGGMESINGAYDLLVVAPAEYAFDRKLGDF